MFSRFATKAKEPNQREGGKTALALSMEHNITLTHHPNRESWLLAALPHLKRIIREAAGPDFADPLISIGFPSVGALRRRQRRMGECWPQGATATGQSTILVSPLEDDPIEVLSILLHELIHASVGVEHGHHVPFKRVALLCGLEGKMTSTRPGPELNQRLQRIAARLGAFPHSRLDVATTERKKQRARLRLYVCDRCGQKVRAAADGLELTHGNDCGGQFAQQ